MCMYSLVINTSGRIVSNTRILCDYKFQPKLVWPILALHLYTLHTTSRYGNFSANLAINLVQTYNFICKTALCLTCITYLAQEMGTNVFERGFSNKVPKDTI